MAGRRIRIVHAPEHGQREAPDDLPITYLFSGDRYRPLVIPRFNPSGKVSDYGSSNRRTPAGHAAPRRGFAHPETRTRAADRRQAARIRADHSPAYLIIVLYQPMSRYSGMTG